MLSLGVRMNENAASLGLNDARRTTPPSANERHLDPCSRPPCELLNGRLQLTAGLVIEPPSPVHAPQPTLPPVRIERPRAEPTAEAVVSRAGHAFQLQAVALQLDQAASLVVDDAADTLPHAIPLTAEREHLPVEPQASVLAAWAQGGFDLAPALHLDPFARLQTQAGLRAGRGAGPPHRNVRDGQAQAVERLLERSAGDDPQEAGQGNVP